MQLSIEEKVLTLAEHLRLVLISGILHLRDEFILLHLQLALDGLPLLLVQFEQLLPALAVLELEAVRVGEPGPDLALLLELGSLLGEGPLREAVLVVQLLHRFDDDGPQRAGEEEAAVRAAPDRRLGSGLPHELHHAFVGRLAALVGDHDGPLDLLKQVIGQWQKGGSDTGSLAESHSVRALLAESRSVRASLAES